MLRINGPAIKRVREKAGMSAEDVAHRIDKSVPYLKRIESGAIRPSLTLLDSIAEVLSVDPVIFIEGASSVPEINDVTNALIDVILQTDEIVLKTPIRNFDVPKSVRRQVLEIILTNLD